MSEADAAMEAWAARPENRLAHRPPMTPELRAKLHAMLDNAITMAYATGSVGASTAEGSPSTTFGLSVSFQIRRKKPGTMGVKAEDFEPLDTSPPSPGQWP